jgi:hypothetical protein
MRQRYIHNIRLIVTVCFLAGQGVIALTQLPVMAQVPPQQPCSFYGEVKVNGEYPQSAVEIRAWIGANSYAGVMTFPWNGLSVYRLDVPADDGNTPQQDGGKENDMVVFTMSGIEAATSGTWQFGKNIKLNVSLTTVPSPGLVGPGWNFVSIPVVPDDGTPSVVFSAIGGANTINNAIYRWDTGLSNYIGYPTAGFGDITCGSGYWLWLNQNNAPLSFSGTRNVTGQEIHILNQGWIVFGHTFTHSTSWLDCTVTNGATTKTITEAEVAGWIQGTAYWFDPARQAFQLTPEDDNFLRPWRAYWLWANTAPLILRIPAE